MDHLRVLDWADRQLKNLKGDFETFENEQPDPLVGDRDSATGEYVIRIGPKGIAAIDDDWIFRVGDILHNLRVSLDYLTFQIVKPPLADRALVRRTQFPIVTTLNPVDDWPGIAGNRLPNVDPAVVSAFEALQPHKRGGGDYNALFLLDALENIHKHRHPLVAYPANLSGGFAGSGTANFELVSMGAFGSTLDPGTEVFRLRFLDPAHTKPNRHFRIPLHVCFDKAGPAHGMPVVVILEHIRNHLRNDVFPALERFI